MYNFYLNSQCIVADSGVFNPVMSLANMLSCERPEMRDLMYYKHGKFVHLVQL